MTKKEAFIEQLSKLPEPYRTAAISQYDEEFSLYNPATITEAIGNFAHWEKTKEGRGFWESVKTHFRFPAFPQQFPLPPYPDTLLPKVEEAEPKQDIIAELRAEIQAMRKELDQLRAKNIETPAEPKAAKLPVTEDEVLKINKERPSFFLGAKGELREGIFRDDYFEEFLHESTAKKVRAFCILSKIAEAQNEMVGKGDTIYTAVYIVSENMIEVRSTTGAINYHFGKMAFHSKQGLKDCIEANRDLWMDYLTN